MIAALARHVRCLSADRRGNLMIEFALAMPILFLLLVGLLDLGRYSMQKSAMLQGAREGAQYGITASDDTSGINATAQSATGVSGATATSSKFCECVSGTTVSCAATCTGGATLKTFIAVTTSASFSSVLGPATTALGSFGSWTPPTSLSATVTMIVP
jgi:Flp pilus assembly protein TadG